MSSQPPVSVPEPGSGPREELPSGQTPKSLGATILLSLKAARDPAAHGAHATLPGASGGSEPVGRGRPRAPLAPRSPLGEAGRYCSPCVPASCPDLSAPPRDPVPGRPGRRGSLRGRAPWWALAPPCWAQGTGCAPDTLCCSSRLRPQLPGPPTRGERARPWTRWLAAVRTPALKPRTPRPAPAPRHGQRDPVTPPPPEQPSHLDLRPQPQRPAAQHQSSLCCPGWGLSPHQDAPPRPRNKAGFGGRGGLARGERGLDGQTDTSLSDFRNSCQLFLRFEPSAQMSRRLMCAPEIARPDGGRPRSATRKRED